MVIFKKQHRQAPYANGLVGQRRRRIESADGIELQLPAKQRAAPTSAAKCFLVSENLQASLLERNGLQSMAMPDEEVVDRYRRLYIGRFLELPDAIAGSQAMVAGSTLVGFTVSGRCTHFGSEGVPTVSHALPFCDGNVIRPAAANSSSRSRRRALKVPLDASSGRSLANS